MYEGIRGFFSQSSPIPCTTKGTVQNSAPWSFTFVGPPPFIVLFSLLNGVFVSCLGQKPRRASSAKREPAVAEHELTMRIVKSSTFETWAFDATSRVDAHNHAIPG